MFQVSPDWTAHPPSVELMPVSWAVSAFADPAPRSPANSVSRATEGWAVQAACRASRARRDGLSWGKLVFTGVLLSCRPVAEDPPQDGARAAPLRRRCD